MPYLEKCNPHLPLKVKLCWGSFQANTKHLTFRKLMKLQHFKSAQLEKTMILLHTHTLLSG